MANLIKCIYFANGDDLTRLSQSLPMCGEAGAGSRTGLLKPAASEPVAGDWIGLSTLNNIVVKDD